MDRQRGWLAFGLGATAVMWSLGLVLAAFVWPVYSGESCDSTPGAVTACAASSQTLFAANGWWVVELLLAVAAVAALALWALHVRCAQRSSRASVVATVCIVALAVFSGVTGFSIGLFVVPVVLLLVSAAKLTPPAPK